MSEGGQSPLSCQPQILEAEQELGSDFAFYEASEDTAAIDFVPDEDDEFSPMPLPLSTEDVEHLLAHIPDIFLSRLVTEAEY